MNELKIQVESKDDINYVVQNLKAFAFQKLESRLAANDQQDLLEACRSTMEEKLDAIIGSIASNIQVNGMDWHPFSNSTEEFEPLDESLQQKLIEYENSIEAVLYRGIQYRQSYPQLIESELDKIRKRANQVMIDDFEQENQARDNRQAFEEAQNVKAKLLNRHVSERCLKDLQSSNTILDGLHKSLPALVAKMDRAKTVLQEEARSKCKAADPLSEDIDPNTTENKEEKDADDGSDNAAELKELNARKKIQLTQLMVRKISQAMD